MAEKQPVRLVDVARAAGVSRGTASNVFNNPAIVRQELRERVETAARTLGYFGPDPKARLLRAGKVNSIGVIPPAELGIAETLRNPVFLQFMLGVSEVCDAEGASLVMIPGKPGGAGPGSALVDGFIFGRAENLEMLKPAQLRRLPFTVVDFDAGPEVSAVKVGAREGCAAAVRHLLQLGHSRFAIVSFLRDTGPARLHRGLGGYLAAFAGAGIDREKLLGYSDAFTEASISLEDVPIIQANPWDANAARLVLDAAPDATAIVSMSVMQAIAIVKEAQRRSISVPEQLSVIGYNDIADAQTCTPPITTIDTRSVEKGRLAAQLLFAGGPPRQIILPAPLILRNSTAPARRST